MMLFKYLVLEVIMYNMGRSVELKRERRVREENAKEIYKMNSES